MGGSSSKSQKLKGQRFHLIESDSPTNALLDDDDLLKSQYFTEDDKPSEIYDTYNIGVSVIEPERTCSLFWRIKAFVFDRTWFFLVIIGIVISLICFGVELTITALREAKFAALDLIHQTWLQWVSWIAWTVVCSVIAVLIIVFVSPHAGGSGIPEMKCILSGITMNRFLNFRTLVAKIIGLIFTTASGFHVGREGPYVHISAIICNLMSKLPVFSNIRKKHAAYLVVLGAACSVGVTSSFGSPIGGVLFSLEVTSSFYLVENIWRSFFVSLVGMLMYTTMRAFINLGPGFLNTEWSLEPYKLIELLIFALLGLIIGVFGGLFLRLLQFSYHLTRVNEKLQTAWGQLGRTLFVALLLSLVTYPIELMRDNEKLSKVISQKDPVTDWTSLLVVIVLRYVLTILAVGFTGITAGIYSPLLTVGAVIGRLYGEMGAVLFSQLGISAGAYAIVGAASFASGVTGTVSTAIIVIEMTYQVHLLLPVLLGVMIASLICRTISPTAYSVMIEAKDLPMMPRFKLYNTITKKFAGDIMHKRVKKLSFNSSFYDAAKLVATHDFPTFPVVDRDGIYLGIVRRANICKVLDFYNIRWRNLRKPSSGRYKAIEIMKRNYTKRQKTRLDETVDQFSDNEEEELEKGSPTIEKPLSTFLDKLPKHDKEHYSILSDDDDPESQGNTDILNVDLPLRISPKEPNEESGDSEACIDIDTTVLSTSTETILTKIHFLFTALGISHLYITQQAKLVGVITRKRLIQTINSLNFSEK